MASVVVSCSGCSGRRLDVRVTHQIHVTRSLFRGAIERGTENRQLTTGDGPTGTHPWRDWPIVEQYPPIGESSCSAMTRASP